MESINGQLWAVSEMCECGKRCKPAWPGGIVKAHHDAYEEMPTEWQEIYPDAES